MSWRGGKQNCHIWSRSSGGSCAKERNVSAIAPRALDTISGAPPEPGILFACLDRSRITKISNVYQLWSYKKKKVPRRSKFRNLYSQEVL
jgi:hypothetical protein